MLDYFYSEGHLTNLVLFPLFLISLFFIIRFIELVDRYSYLPCVTNPTCKKCHVNLSLITVCKHDKSTLISMIPALYGYFTFIIWSYVIHPYLKSLPPITPISGHEEYFLTGKYPPTLIETIIETITTIIQGIMN